MCLVRVCVRLVRRWISSEMSAAVSSCAKRSFSIFVSSSAIGCSNSRKVVFTGGAILPPLGVSVFDGHRVEGAPEVPGGDRAPRPPGLPEPLQGARGHLPALEIRDSYPFLHSRTSQ